jgi:hypothetical protein
MLNALAHVQLRQQALQWSVATARVGDSADTILERAEQYLSWLTYPVRDEVVMAMEERLHHRIQ